jgi:hypothetical protein
MAYPLFLRMFNSAANVVLNVLLPEKNLSPALSDPHARNVECEDAAPAYVKKPGDLIGG